MNPGNRTLLWASAVGMELSWLYAWCLFILASGFRRPFPLPEAGGTFLLAAVITLLSGRRGWRVYQILGIHVLGFCLAGMRAVSVVVYPTAPFWNRDWVLAFLGQPKDPLQWVLIVLTLFWVLVFWIGGATLARRSTAYLTICARFDLGVAAFLALLLLKLLLVVKGGISIQGAVTERLLIPFFLFSLLAIGLARSQGQGQKDFLSGYRGIGVLLSFTSAVLVFGSGTLLLLMPTLQLAAEIGYDALKQAAEPLGPVLVAVLRFLFFGRQNWKEPASPSASEGGPPQIHSGEGTWWGALAERILGWGLAGLAALLILLLCGLAAWFLMRWLLSRTPAEKKKHGFWDMLLWWISMLWRSLSDIFKRIGFSRTAGTGAQRIFSALLRWGRRSGFPLHGNETPMEYSLRLSGLFPSLGRDIHAIIEEYHRQVYGERVLSREQLASARSALKRLRSPFHWPLRLRRWFLSSGATA